MTLGTRGRAGRDKPTLSRVHLYLSDPARGLLKGVTIELVAKSAGADAQKLSGSLSMLIALGEGREDCCLLGLLNGGLEVERTGSGRCVHFLRQIVSVYDRAFDDDDQPFDAILELAHVPRPRVFAQNTHRRFGDSLGFAFVSRTRSLQAMFNEVRNIVGAFP